MPLVMHYWADLQSIHGLRCYGNTRNAWQSPAVIRQTHRTPHACRTCTLRMPAKTPLARDKIDAPAACAVPFRPCCGGVVTRTRNVSEYMLVLAVCLVSFCRRMLCGDISFTVCFFQPRLSVTLSTKSTKFGSRYLVDRLSKGGEIWHVVSPGLAVHRHGYW